jgi:6-phosphogluconolactonase
VPAANIHEFPAADELDLEHGAKAFDAQLYEFWSELPKFDIVLLGVGPDGHVASLFPGHEQVIPGTFTVMESDSPKPPPQRLSLSFEILNNADQVWFTVAGADKAEAVAAAFSLGSTLPVARVKSANNLWFLDRDAASKLTD